MKAPLFKIGDTVTFQNEAGLIWTGWIVSGMEMWPQPYHHAYGLTEPYWRYYCEGSDTPWFPHDGANLMLE